MRHLALIACFAIVVSGFVVAIGIGYQINECGSVLTPFLPVAGLLLLLSLGTLIWSIHRQRGAPQPLFQSRWPAQIRQPRQRTDQAAYVVVPEEAAVVQQVFAWAGQERLSMGAIARRLTDASTCGV